MDQRTNKDTAQPLPELPGTGSDAALRQQAEEIARQTAAASPTHSEKLSLEAMRKTLHELRVHQIELEMQNEELRRTQVNLAAAQARYFDLFDLAPVGYCVVSEAGLIRQANLTATTLLGVPRGTLIKQPFSRFIHKADQDVYYFSRKQLLATHEPQSCDLRMLKQDGTQFWARLVNTFAQDPTGAPLLRVTLTDITERVRLREALQEKNTELMRAKSAAEDATLAKSNFLSNMSHELRSPLNAILGFAQLLQADGTQQTVTQKDNIEQIIKAGWYLLSLINELLDLPLVESGKLQLSIAPMSLDEVILECESMMLPKAKSYGLALHSCRFESPCVVLADRTRVKQIMINLISNAIKYNREGGSVVLECTLKSAERVRIGVKDTGAGLSPEKLAQLFQPFNRLGRENTGEEGTGIGLVMTKRLTELMGGSIGVESVEGVGSEFWVELIRASDG